MNIETVGGGEQFDDPNKRIEITGISDVVPDRIPGMVPEPPRPYRMQGELERSHPKIEPLPPTPITDRARDRLAVWGMSDDQIDHLRDLTSSFRYDLVPQRAERMAERGEVIYETPEGREKVVFPGFFDYGDRLDGQCTDLAVQHLRALGESGLVGESTGIRPMFIVGNSRTHFVGDNNKHAWIGLLGEGQPVENVVTVDSSFQEISTTSDNGYRVIRSQVDPIGFIGQVAGSCDVIPAHFEYGAMHTLDVPNVERVLLGMSADGALAYNVYFLKDQNTYAYYPAVNALRSDGNIADEVTCVGGNGEIRFVHDAALTDAQRREMETITRTLATISPVHDQEQAAALLDETVEVLLTPNPAETEHTLLIGYLAEPGMRSEVVEKLASMSDRERSLAYQWSMYAPEDLPHLAYDQIQSYQETDPDRVNPAAQDSAVEYVSEIQSWLGFIRTNETVPTLIYTEPEDGVGEEPDGFTWSIGDGGGNDPLFAEQMEYLSAQLEGYKAFIRGTRRMVRQPQSITQGIPTETRQERSDRAATEAEENIDKLLRVLGPSFAHLAKILDDLGVNPDDLE